MNNKNNKEIISDLITQERKDELKEVADRQFEEILKNLKLEKLNELEQIYLQLEICKRLARYYEYEKTKLSKEALKKQTKTNEK